LVIDEADRLFDDTILPDLRKIIDYLPKKKQVILATATINEKFND
jgi:superfamily II DNA/RNA helicase